MKALPEQPGRVSDMSARGTLWTHPAGNRHAVQISRIGLARKFGSSFGRGTKTPTGRPQFLRTLRAESRISRPQMEIVDLTAIRRT